MTISDLSIRRPVFATVLSLMLLILGVMAALRLPILEGGRLRAQLASRSAEADAAVDGYNAALLRALREVADELTTLQTLERQQLQLLLLEARLAVARADQKAFATAIGAARSWLDGHFATTDAAVAKLSAELKDLASVDIAPALPDVSGSLRLLEQMVPITRAGA